MNKEIECYALHVLSTNIEELEYISLSFKCNKDFVGIHLDKTYGTIALFKSAKGRNYCYNRITNKFGEEKPRVAIIIPTAMIDERYVK